MVGRYSGDIGTKACSSSVRLRFRVGLKLLFRSNLSQSLRSDARLNGSSRIGGCPLRYELWLLHRLCVSKSSLLLLRLRWLWRLLRRLLRLLMLRRLKLLRRLGLLRLWRLLLLSRLKRWLL